MTRERAKNVAFTGAEAVAGSRGRSVDASRSRAVGWLVALLLLGGAVRVAGVTWPPLDFHATRQFHSALLARAYYVDVREAPAPERRVAEAAKPREIEPPIMELAATAGYLLTGGERLWIPRTLAVLAWLAGGVFLFLLMRRVAGADAGLVAVAAHLLLPYGIQASRSFQPDPLMVATIMAATWALVEQDDEPARKRWLAPALAALAILVKLVAAFYVLPVALALAARRDGLRKALRPAAWFGVVALAPAALYHLWGLVLTDVLSGQTDNRIDLEFLATSSFWREWARQLSSVVDPLVVFLAAVGIWAWRSDRAGAVGIALLIGYALFGVTFAYHYSTHDYYHLPLVPIVAFGLGLAWSVLRARLDPRNCRLATAALVALGVIAGVVAVRDARTAPVNGEAPLARSVAGVVGHSTRAVMLSRAYGLPLQFYGGFTGPAWPNQADLRAADVFDKCAVPARERLNGLVRDGAEYFVVTAPEELALQPALEAALRTGYQLVGQGDGWLVFDLRRPVRDPA